MIKTFSKKFWIALISCCCIGTGIALACASDFDEEYGTSNFSPEVFVDSAYSPFFYSWQFYYQIGHDESQHTRFNEKNVSDWSAFLNKKLTEKELGFLLQKAGKESIDSTVLKQKNNPAVASFLNYLQLAKKAEGFALDDIPYSWAMEDKKTVKKTFDASSLNRDLQTAFSATTDNFIKERYWFQLVRSYFFNGSPQQAIDLFTAREKDMPHNDVYYRTLSYAAGAYYKLKNFSKANYYYSKVYANCDALKTTAHYSFHPQEEKDWNATLALCSNTDEKATLWQMLGIFYADEERAINEIYKLNPASNKMDVLLARAVNKYEQKFDHKEGDYSAMPADTLVNLVLPALITKIATANNTARPWIWQMAAGYINTLDKKYEPAATWFAKTEKNLPPEKAAHAQLRLLQLINTIARAKIADAKLENETLNDIQWLKDLGGASIPDLRYQYAFSWLKQQMSKKYARQKELVKAECFLSSTGFYASNKNVEDMKAFLNKKEKTPFEKLCAALSVKKIDDLVEFQAIKLAYTDSIDAAIEKMNSLSGTTTVLAGNPFNGRIQDCHDCDHEAAQKIKYTKLSFLKKIKELEQKINAGEEVYTNSVLLANAWYNISHFGNARFFYECKVIGEGFSQPSGIDSLFRRMLINMNLAAKYYTLGLQKAANDEQRAKCQYMLAKCQRNQWYNKNIYLKKGNDYDDQLMVDLSFLNGFKALKQYPNTQFYKEVIKECGYFKTYAGKN